MHQAVKPTNIWQKNRLASEGRSSCHSMRNNNDANRIDTLVSKVDILLKTFRIRLSDFEKPGTATGRLHVPVWCPCGGGLLYFCPTAFRSKSLRVLSSHKEFVIPQDELATEAVVCIEELMERSWGRYCVTVRAHYNRKTVFMTFRQTTDNKLQTLSRPAGINSHCVRWRNEVLLQCQAGARQL